MRNDLAAQAALVMVSGGPTPMLEIHEGVRGYGDHNNCGGNNSCGGKDNDTTPAKED